ncbi:MAG TPA: type III polyketide synthase, partial [Ignavibacteria bacterium]|nr:type III polyketide synthase [Ignavibacteria bacterium]
MPKIISTATSDAPYILPQSEIKNFIYNLFSGSGLEIERLISVFDNSEITQRHISVKPEWLAKEHTFKEQSEIFTEVSLELAKQAIVECLAGVNINPAKIDNMIYVTSTGVMTPTLDARLFNELGFNSHIKRLPLWGLGCAGGAAGISRAMDLTKAYPKENVLVVAVELCSLTFQKDDISKSNIVAASLFGDGCACVLIAGDENELSANENCPELVASLSTIYDNSLDVMGWDIVDTGFSVVFSKDIPT